MGGWVWGGALSVGVVGVTVSFVTPRIPGCRGRRMLPVSNSSYVPVEITQPGTWAWLVNFRPWREILHDEPTFLLCEIEFYVLCALTYAHAHRHGGRYLWLWWTTILHGLTTECISYWYEDVDNFWHAQSTVMVFGRREPLHIICLYPGFVYTSTVAVARMNLVENARPFAAGLGEALLDLPYDVMGVRLLWWTWHDTDTNIYDRAYHVPWTSYFFHMSFGLAFTFLLQRARRYCTGLSGTFGDDDIAAMPWHQKELAQNWRGELAVLLIVGFGTFPLGVMAQFVPLYHVPHDILGIHTEICVWILVGLYASVMLYALLRAHPVKLKEEGQREVTRGSRKRGPGRWHVDEVFLAVLVHYIFYSVLVVVADPGDVRATGLHQSIAPPGCPHGTAVVETTSLRGFPDTSFDLTRTKFGDPDSGAVSTVALRYGFYESLPFPGQRIVVERNHSVCPENYSEPFGFFCPAEGRCSREDVSACTLPSPGQEWFTICGHEYGHGEYAEYVFLLVGFNMLALYAFAAVLAYPRTIFDVVCGCSFPRYYKITVSDAPVQILDRRVRGADVEYFVARARGPGEWLPRSRLVSDGAGPTFGERGGLYGRHGVHAETSSRERLRVFDARANALERIDLWKKNKYL